MSWQPIETAPDGTVIVGDVGIEATAVAHFCGGEWLLGPANASYYERLDFTPRWWLPKDFPANPFRTPLPAPPEADGVAP